MRTYIVISYFAFFLLNINIEAQDKPDFDKICLSQEEFKLYNQINKLRIENDRDIIPLSRSLCYVAKMHLYDLIKHRPDTSICNMHSWSDKGSWTACCYNTYIKQPGCMHSKPKELTDYRYNGWELIFWDSEAAQPDSAMEFWERTDISLNVLINNHPSYKKDWNAIGVAITGKYACLWLGHYDDPEEAVAPCSNQQADTTANEDQPEEVGMILKETDGYHIIVASFTNEEDATESVRSYRDKGYPKSGIIQSNGKYRISLSSHGSLQQAKNAKDNLGAGFGNAWILKY
ncbi:MAG: SPOR domain-containing protein [Bacteroidales bacterium]|nr:SPOR domain-containing protein [Bacteroidales bacterium]MCF8352160.1 SPOR domain-containing protein [Bacteroidales bacterium]MCF8377456.1 SPOR domain-containing protein [Bacteroidales bacterium]MCF8401547.1 SPOR domain-containing protein [Bacteroidales bacterium]